MVDPIITSLVVFLIAAAALRAEGRRSRQGYVRWQWRRPHWILLRLSAVVFVAHIFFVIFGIHPAFGYLFVALFIVVCLTGLGSILEAGLLGVGWLLYNWIYWFPSRREVILRSSIARGKSTMDASVGLEGIALTDLRPGGRVRLQGVEREARAAFGTIAKGETVIVESVSDFEVVVRRLED